MTITKQIMTNQIRSYSSNPLNSYPILRMDGTRIKQIERMSTDRNKCIIAMATLINTNTNLKFTTMKHEKITAKIIKAYYQVYNQLGYGFLEKVYENALMIELQKMNLQCCKQYPINVYYDEQMVGKYYADILIQDSVIVEIKACSCLLLEHEAQLLNYLKGTNVEVGLLFNFGVKAEFKRKLFDNKYKMNIK